MEWQEEVREVCQTTGWQVLGLEASSPLETYLSRKHQPLETELATRDRLGWLKAPLRIKSNGTEGGTGTSGMETGAETLTTRILMPRALGKAPAKPARAKTGRLIDHWVISVQSSRDSGVLSRGVVR